MEILMNKVIVTPKVTTRANETFGDFSRRIDTPIIAESPEFIPTYETEGAACCDLKAYLPDGPICIGHLETVKIYVGFRMAVPAGYEAQIRSRSSFGAKSVITVPIIEPIIPNDPGTIDEDFRGKMCVLLTNLRQEPIEIKHLDRIAQMALKPVWHFNFVAVDTLNKTERGEGGFGSTGK